MTTWIELIRLNIKFLYNVDRDDVVEGHIFPFNIDNLKLESVSLWAYDGIHLPICISQFQTVRVLDLWEYVQLRGQLLCEIGNGIVRRSFQMLKRLELQDLRKLERMVGSSSKEEMLKPKDIDVCACGKMKRFRTNKLPCLTKLRIHCCSNFEALELESGNFLMFKDLRLL